MSFTNEQILESELPSILKVKYHPIQKKYQTVSIIVSSITMLFPLVVLTGLHFIANASWVLDYLWYILGVWIVLLCIVVLFAIKRYQSKGYALRERDIVYKSGWLWRKSTVVPFNRIQHTEIDQGPIERMYSLSSLKVYTAGGSSSDLKIPGLLPETAHKLKDYIQLKVGYEEEE